MIIPRNALGAIQVLIFHRILQHHAGAHLADHAALHLLPGRLRGGILVTARRFQFLAALGQFLVRDQHIGRALAQVDAHPVAGLEQRQPAARGGFRRGIED